MPISGITLLGLQARVQAKLEEDPWFVDIPVISDVRGDPISEMDQAIEKALICVVIQTPTANQRNGNITKPYFDDIRVILTIWENAMLNRGNQGTGKDHLTTAQIVAALLLAWAPEDMQPFAPVNPFLRDALDPELVGTQVTFRTSGGYHYTPET